MPLGVAEREEAAMILSSFAATHWLAGIDVDVGEAESRCVPSMQLMILLIVLRLF